MEKTLAAINQMRELGIISDYAIGGGMAAMFYMEPALTYDLDVFCVLAGEEKRKIGTAPCLTEKGSGKA